MASPQRRIRRQSARSKPVVLDGATIEMPSDIEALRLQLAQKDQALSLALTDMGRLTFNLTRSQEREAQLVARIQELETEAGAPAKG